MGGMVAAEGVGRQNSLRAIALVTFFSFTQNQTYHEANDSKLQGLSLDCTSLKALGAASVMFSQRQKCFANSLKENNETSVT